ncbi:NADH-quinone oxidoreductase subunit NuoE [Auraticoccus monumenti]|uniref:NADH dehydrogenase subunit E n=1 Tax=Auraticoccus monumenti TaxID=675864 RepID=A0A1G6WU54_9ACTN|nr:NADH-quinone oxidoreductase subunit NuoE [Auraticoccus monumenti]SDD69418.1 NADH dehydrogenase subunit E [Auraticoccus monumenti]
MSTDAPVGHIGNEHHFPTHFTESGGIDFSGDQTTALTEVHLEEMRSIAARYPQPRSALLPMLHLVQSVEGRVTPAGVEACADVLGISAAEVSGVATFYTMYKRKPVGRHHVGVCTTALCAILGGDEVLAALQQHLGVGNDETTADGTITLEHIECNAACDYAPVMMVNWEFFDDVTPGSAVEVVDALREGREVVSSRGARISSWREAERVLAGFPDGRADEGPTAGEKSLLGLRIANERGWSAPDPRTAEAEPVEGPAASEAEAVGTGQPDGGRRGAAEKSSEDAEAAASGDQGTTESTRTSTDEGEAK